MRIEIGRALGSQEPNRNTRGQRKGAKMRIQWERMNSDCGRVYRSRVPGGWLVFLSEVDRSFEPYDGFSERSHAALTFYPDAEHEWLPAPR